MRLAILGMRGVFFRVRGFGVLAFVMVTFVMLARLLGGIGFRHRRGFGGGSEFRLRIFDRRADLGGHRRVRGFAGGGRRLLVGLRGFGGI